MNLCQTLPADQLKTVLEAVDTTMANFEISKKQMEIIPATGIPEVMKYYLASKAIANCSEGTLKQYRYKLINFFTEIPKAYSDILPNDIRIYMFNYRMQHNASDSYMESIRITLHGFFQWLVDNEYLQRNPCAKIEKIRFNQKRREAFSTFALEELRWKCKDAREKALVDFLYSTGLRVSECANVMLSEIDWDKNSVLIPHGKGDKERIVYFNDESKVSLKKYIDSRNDDVPALWVSSRKPFHQIHAHALEDIIRDIGKRAGEHAFPHKFRHTFATVGLRNGLSIDQLQALMGHSNPQTTLIYADQDKSQLRMEHSKAFG
jgi:integrase/recombinase XerD